MMAPPRFQCLNAVTQVSRQAPSLRAAFSSSRVVQADQPPRPSATSDLLSAGDGAQPPYPSIRPNFSNPIQEPANRSQPTGSNVQRLLASQARRVAQRAQDTTRMSTAVEAGQYGNGVALTRQITRRFKPGDVYAPHDLSEVEMAKWKKRAKPQHDVFDVLDFKPLDNYRNFSIMSEYMTPMGRIIHSKETGLRPVNQRRISKAIRRCIGMGLMPSVHRHPELLYNTPERRSQVQTPSRTDVPSVY
ncbi:ribosomal protein S18 [Mollisia scopiformis]|uniref:Small ribosomal subunit protein bS18m n=1 Tax=Mollisia scopiformis TaxID=149040 RepID=A0A194X770_MOLSC|nr:ribosomal protein S18 [Mollisia scopiformis]KUJ16020.1 ribosomal protein S18 [Mollisia scopiformis]